MNPFPNFKAVIPRRHTPQGRADQIRRRRRLVAAGKCGQCAQAPLHTQTLCEKCAEKHRAANRALVAARAAQRKCWRCKWPAAKETLHHKYPQCAHHLAENNARAKVANDRRIASRHKKGLCIVCGKPAAKDKIRCSLHLAIARRRAAEIRAKARAANLCQDCRTAPAPPGQRCQECRLINRVKRQARAQSSPHKTACRINV